MNKNNINKKLFVELSGGLGNQMFQYAYARYIEKTFGYKAIYLTKSYDSDKLRKVSLQHFRILDSEFSNDMDYFEIHKLKKILFRILRKLNFVRDKLFGASYSKPSLTYKLSNRILNRIGLYSHESSKYIYPVRAVSIDAFAKGAWHTPIYANQIYDTLKNELELKELDAVPKDYLNQIHSSESICLHIRRGDYVNYSYYIVCDADYYSRAIREMKKKCPTAKFFVFSDDINWAKNNLKEDAVYVKTDCPDYIDWYLMKECKHFIISNSTFSWWAAYMGRYGEKVVMTPDLWYSPDYGENKPQLNMKGWIVIPTNAEEKEMP